MLPQLIKLMEIVLLGVNQCVGLHNERYFILFMYQSFSRSMLRCSHAYHRVYLVVCSFCFSTLGWPALWESFEYFDDVGLNLCVTNICSSCSASLVAASHPDLVLSTLLHPVGSDMSRCLDYVWLAHVEHCPGRNDSRKPRL
jgi:hypothetical protein